MGHAHVAAGQADAGAPSPTVAQSHPPGNGRYLGAGKVMCRAPPQFTTKQVAGGAMITVCGSNGMAGLAIGCATPSPDST